MFGKRVQLASGPDPRARTLAGHGLTVPAWAGPLANPLVGTCGAALLFVLAVVSLVAVTGDPRAGAPRVRISLIEKLAPLSLAPAAAPANPLAPAAEAGSRQALAPAPIAGLTAPGPGGLLPVIAPDGRTPWQAYARPFRDVGAPKVALVIGGLGLNATTTRAAIEQLPPEVTLSFVPYAEGLQGWIDLARANGHEVLLEAPMEPLDYPQNDPGPYTLMAQDPPQETVKRLEVLLSRATGYFGVTNYLGGRFLTSDAAVGTLSAALRQRGVAFIDDGAAASRGGGEPRASAERVIDQNLDGGSIDQELAQLESSASQHGKALGSGFAYPVTLQEVQRWAAGLAGRGLQLAPASAVMSRPR
jgi:polysaccharide deacetylase 2 family uncharacterized protein YibQ